MVLLLGLCWEATDRIITAVGLPREGECAVPCPMLCYCEILHNWYKEVLLLGGEAIALKDILE